MKKKELILIGIILAIAFSALGIIQLFKKPGAYVVVRLGQDEIARYSLSVDGEYPVKVTFTCPGLPVLMAHS